MMKLNQLTGVFFNFISRSFDELRNFTVLQFLRTGALFKMFADAFHTYVYSKRKLLFEGSHYKQRQPNYNYKIVMVMNI
jgi:hypothetical protein